MAEIAAPIDAGEVRLDISERELLADTSAIHEPAEDGELRGRVVLVSGRVSERAVDENDARSCDAGLKSTLPTGARRHVRFRTRW